MRTSTRTGARSDESVERTVGAFARAVRWSLENRMGVPGLLDQSHLRELLAIFEGRRRFEARWARPLVMFAQVAFRLHPRMPGPKLSMADALTVMPALAGQSSPGWAFDGTVSAEVAAALGYRRRILAIDAQRAENEVAWRRHAERARAFIMNAASRGPPGGTAAVVGAARANDLPLEELARHFDRVLLLDIDGEALLETHARVEPAELRRKFELRTMDFTGLVARASRALDAHTAKPANRCADLYTRWALAAPPPIFWAADDDVRLAVSCLVVSQLSPRLEALATSHEDDAAFSPRLAQAQELFAWRLQHVHIQALAAQAPHVVLISDVSEQITGLGQDGVVRPLDEARDLLGVARLRERLPGTAAVHAEDEWTWRRVVPKTTDQPGSDMRVQALETRAA